MEITPTSIQKINNGKNMLIFFDDKSSYIISSELLRVESPSAEIQGHGGPKKIVRNKSEVLIDQIESVGNYAVRIIFSDNHCSGIYSWKLLHDFAINHDKYLKEYYKSL